jgi:hypothetical protein
MVVLSQTTSEAITKFQTQVLEKIKKTFTHQDRAIRDLNSVVLRMRKSDLELAKTSLREMRRDLSSKLQDGTEHDSVYCLTTSLFRLDQEI